MLANGLPSIREWTLGKTLGSGGYAMCYEIYKEESIKFACKVIKKSILSHEK